MKPSKYLVLVAIVLVSCLGCKSKKPDLSASLQSYFEEMGLEMTDYKYYVVINLEACSSCSDRVKDFLAANSDNKEMVVFLSSMSAKKARFILDEHKGEQTMVIDSEQRALKKYFLVESKPVIYEQTETKILRKEMDLGSFSGYWVAGNHDRADTLSH